MIPTFGTLGRIHLAFSGHIQVQDISRASYATSKRYCATLDCFFCFFFMNVNRDSLNGVSCTNSAIRVVQISIQILRKYHCALYPNVSKKNRRYNFWSSSPSVKRKGKRNTNLLPFYDCLIVLSHDRAVAGVEATSAREEDQHGTCTSHEPTRFCYGEGQEHLPQLYRSVN